MGRMLIAFLKAEQGATAIEYGLIAALIAMICIVGMGVMGGGISGLFNHISNRATTIWDTSGT